MPSIICLSFFILGLVVASVTANQTTTGMGVSIPASNEFGSNNNYSTIVTPLRTTSDITRSTDTVNATTPSIMNFTLSPSTIKQKGEVSTPKPMDPSKSTTNKIMDKRSTAMPKTAESAETTGIIILVVIILVAVGFGVACYLARRRGRRYSADFTSRPDEANIPLSTVEPELPIDNVPQNGLQTFESTETMAKEPEAQPEVQEQKVEADKSVVDPSAESAAPAPSPDGSEDKPKEDVAEQSPPAPVEPSAEEKTDDEGVVSNKTSVESLKEANENNSNNADFSQKRDLKQSNIFWDVPLDCPV